ncbi:hypothetical protein ACKWTF_007175 [Chironomus riparius]
MNYRAIKVCVSIDNSVENFYIKFDIKHFSRFYHLRENVFKRNPSVNSPNLKVYWIDADNDEILISCDEDFAVYLEEGKGRKLFFSVTNNNSQNNEPQEEDSIPMESEFIETTQRKCKKGHKDDEKRSRRVEKLSKKLRHYEEACKNEEERSKCRQPEKREVKNNERLERARRRVEQIRTIISSIDPANLNSSNTNEANNPGPSTTSNEATPQSSDLPFSPETVRLLSNAIANCLQPCNLINKVLNEVYAIIPQVMEQASDVLTSNIDQQDQQQQTEVPKNTTATNTSNANTPLLDRNSNQEIEELFKEAAKELEKMNEIVNSNKMETSTSSSFTGITQIERVFKNINDSAISDATIIDMNSSRNSQDQLDSSFPEESMNEEHFKVITPPKSMRSRESSIEIHDVSSVMSDDSRDWTLLSQDELSIEPVPAQRNVDPKTGAIPKNINQVSVDAEIQTNEDKADSIKSVSIETQTPSSLLSGMNQQQLQASVQKSIDIVQKSIESIHKSIETSAQKPENSPQVEVPVEQPKSVTEKEISVEKPNVVPDVNMRRDIYPNLPPSAPVIPETSQANLNAARLSQIINNNKPQQKFEPAVVVYDPNPKINSAVHTMMNMGFSNEDNWLTQLLINVDGDIAKALNFLTPQPKNRKQ